VQAVPDLEAFAPTADALWAMYRHALERAVEHRAALVTRLARGVPDLKPTTTGAPWADSAIAQHEVAALIDRYCRADKALEDAARTLVDCLELPDGGARDGVVYTLAIRNGRA
jgi:hypothetical protein